MAKIFDRRATRQSPILGPDGLPLSPVLRRAENGATLLDHRGRPIGQQPRGLVTDHRGKPYTPDVIRDTPIPLTEEEKRIMRQLYETGRTAPKLDDVLDAVRDTPIYKHHAANPSKESREILGAIARLHPAAHPTRQEAAEAFTSLILHHHLLAKPPSPIATPPDRAPRTRLRLE